MTRTRTTLHCEALDGALRVRVESTGSRNLMTCEALTSLQSLFESATVLESSAVLVTGSPGKHFMVGGDLNELRTLDGAAAEALGRAGAAAFGAVLRCPRPVVAALNGDALGAGFLLALAADVRIAARGARLGYPEIRVGLMPGTGGTDLLVRMAGLAIARSWCLSGALHDADHAATLGLVDQVCAPEQLDALAIAKARELGALSRSAYAATKAALWASASGSLESARAQELAAFRACFESPEARAEIARFFETTSGAGPAARRP